MEGHFNKEAKPHYHSLPSKKYDKVTIGHLKRRRNRPENTSNLVAARMTNSSEGMLEPVKNIVNLSQLPRSSWLQIDITNF